MCIFGDWANGSKNSDRLHFLATRARSQDREERDHVHHLPAGTSYLVPKAVQYCPSRHQRLKYPSIRKGTRFLNRRQATPSPWDQALWFFGFHNHFERSQEVILWLSDSHRSLNSGRIDLQPSGWHVQPRCGDLPMSHWKSSFLQSQSRQGQRVRHALL